MRKKTKSKMEITTMMFTRMMKSMIKMEACLLEALCRLHALKVPSMILLTVRLFELLGTYQKRKKHQTFLVEHIKIVKKNRHRFKSLNLSSCKVLYFSLYSSFFIQSFKMDCRVVYVRVRLDTINK